MSTSELQRVVIERLRADSAVNALVAGRVYDNPPPSPTFPYISTGPDQVLPQRADCYDGSEINLQLDAWSRKSGSVEAKRIVEAMRSSLTDASLTLTGNRLVDISIESTQTLRDPDGITSHGIVNVRALTEPA